MNLPSQYRPPVKLNTVMEPVTKKHIHVVGAVILREDKVLCAQRGATGNLAGMWEFPGGKIEPGESPQQALRREIREELDCTIEVGEEITTTEFEYNFGFVHLTTFYCALVEGVPAASEHAELKWLEPRELHHLNWAPADIPAITLIAQELNR